MLQTLSLLLLVTLVAWSYQAIQPSPPKICGSPNGPPVTSSRINLRDGGHLAYVDFGVTENATYKIIFIHGFRCCEHDEVLEELGIYLLSFDRAGYGESDPNSNLNEKIRTLDIEELAEKLQLGPKIHVLGYSMGGEIVWSCLKFIPHRGDVEMALKAAERVMELEPEDTGNNVLLLNIYVEPKMWEGAV